MPHGQLFQTLSPQSASGFTQSCNQNGEGKYKGLTVKRSTHGKYNLNYYWSSICQNQVAFYCFFLHLPCLKMKSKIHRFTFPFELQKCASRRLQNVCHKPKNDYNSNIQRAIAENQFVVVQFAKFDAWSRHAPLFTYETWKSTFPFALEDASFLKFHNTLRSHEDPFPVAR